MPVGTYFSTMTIKQFSFNPFQENTYLLIDDPTKTCWIIDPGMSNRWEWSAMKDYLVQNGLTPKRVLLTHCHVDHLMGTGFLKEEYGLLPEGPVEDYVGLPTPVQQGQLFGVGYEKEVVPVAHNIKEGDTLSLGASELQILDIPGHSHHGLCFYFPTEKVVFSGDVLFCGSIGRSDFGPQMGCDGELLIQGIQTKLLALPPDTVVYPGHGPSTTIEQELMCNPYF